MVTQPFGQFLLLGIATGLIGNVIWYLVQANLDSHLVAADE